MVDGCTACLTRNNQPLTVTRARPDGSHTATYRCRDCGHQWRTSWGR